MGGRVWVRRLQAEGGSARPIAAPPEMGARRPAGNPVLSANTAHHSRPPRRVMLPSAYNATLYGRPLYVNRCSVSAYACHPASRMFLNVIPQQTVLYNVYSNGEPGVRVKVFGTGSVGMRGKENAYRSFVRAARWGIEAGGMRQVGCAVRVGTVLARGVRGAAARMLRVPNIVVAWCCTIWCGQVATGRGSAARSEGFSINGIHPYGVWGMGVVGVGAAAADSGAAVIVPHRS